jgi:hypothetical protein
MAKSHRTGLVRRGSSGVRAWVRWQPAVLLFGTVALVLAFTGIVTAGAAQAGLHRGRLSCTSATACTASGQYSPGGKAAYFIEAWNGRSWRLVTAPHPAGFAQGALNGMSCAPARCTAVGAWSGGPVPVATLAIAN